MLLISAYQGFTNWKSYGNADTQSEDGKEATVTVKEVFPSHNERGGGKRQLETSWPTGNRVGRRSDLIPELGRCPEKGTATATVFLCGEFHGQRSLVGYSPWGCERVGLQESDWTTNTFTLHFNMYLRVFLYKVSVKTLPFTIHKTSVSLPNTRVGFGEGNGTPPQYSCLKNPMDGGAW